jgi:hypothetical protein
LVASKVKRWGRRRGSETVEYERQIGLSVLGVYFGCSRAKMFFCFKGKW